jgi:quercetin dioxygenase-like cupin family protein
VQKKDERVMMHHVLEEFLTYSSTGPTKSVFFEAGRLKAQVMGLEAGQIILPCRMDHDVFFYVMEGKGWAVIDGEMTPLAATSWLFVPKEKGTRSLEAATRMAILAVQVRD